MGGCELASSVEVIAHLSQVAIAIATCVGAGIAYKVFVKEASDRSDHLKRQEMRELIAELSAAIESCRAKVNQINVVSIEKVPYFHEEFSRIEASIGLAKAFELNDLVEASTKYVREIRTYRNGIVLLKRKRPKNVDSENPLPSEYKVQREKVSGLHANVMKAREAFFKQAGAVLGTTLSDASTDDRKELLPNEEEPNL